MDFAKAYIEAAADRAGLSPEFLDGMQKTAEEQMEAWEVGQEVKLRSTREAWARRTLLRNTQDIRRALGHIALVRPLWAVRHSSGGCCTRAWGARRVIHT